ncbi:MAG: sigma-70 family RNA polymerase sigma factor [Pseudomonadota bacterium]
MHGRTTEALPLAVLMNASPPSSPAAMPSFQVVYEQQFDFVWTSVQRLGVDAGAVDDVVQEVFIVIHSRLHTLQHPEALRSWVYGVVRRTVSTYHRARRARAVVSATADGVEAESHGPTPFDVAQTNSDMQFVAKLLAELDEPRRELLALVDLHEMTVPEAAAALDMPLNTAYSRLRKARIAFEAALARHDARGEGR